MERKNKYLTVMTVGHIVVGKFLRLVDLSSDFIVNGHQGQVEWCITATTIDTRIHLLIKQFLVGIKLSFQRYKSKTVGVNLTNVYKKNNMVNGHTHIHI